MVSNKVMSSPSLGVAVEVGSRTAGGSTPSNSSVAPGGSSSSSSNSIVSDLTEPKQSRGPTWARPGASAPKPAPAAEPVQTCSGSMPHPARPLCNLAPGMRQDTPNTDDGILTNGNVLLEERLDLLDFLDDVHAEARAATATATATASASASASPSPSPSPSPTPSPTPSPSPNQARSHPQPARRAQGVGRSGPIRDARPGPHPTLWGP